MKSMLNFLFRDIREVVAVISKEGVEAERVTGVGFNGHVSVEEFEEGDEIPDVFTPSTVIISGGCGEWKLEVPKYVRNKLVAMTLKIDTIRAHGVLHSPKKGTSATILVNDRLLDRIFLAQRLPHGDDYGVDSRRPIPIFRYIDTKNSTQTIKIGVDQHVSWDVDWVTLEPVILRREIRPEAAMVIGAIISALIGAIVSFFII